MPEAAALQRSLHRAGGGEGAVALVVKAPQVAVHRGRHPAEAVVAAVLLEVGAVVGGQRQRERTRGVHGGGAQRAGCRHVNELRAQALQPLAQVGRAGQTQAQIAVHRDRHAAGAPFVGIGAR